MKEGGGEERRSWLDDEAKANGKKGDSSSCVVLFRLPCVYGWVGSWLCSESLKYY